MLLKNIPALLCWLSPVQGHHPDRSPRLQNTYSTA